MKKNPELDESVQTLWTIKELAIFLNVCEWTARKYVNSDGAEGILRINQRIIRIQPEAFLQWLGSRE